MSLHPNLWQPVHDAATFTRSQRISLKVSRFEMSGRASVTMPILYRGETRVHMTLHQMDACP
jgi:hypothetical protein